MKVEMKVDYYPGDTGEFVRVNEEKECLATRWRHLSSCKS